MRRICLLTGASGLLGQRFIERLAPRYEIVAVYHSSPINYATQDQFFVDPLAPNHDLADNEFAVRAVCADLTRETESTRVVGEALSAFGAVDLLVCAAGQRRRSPMFAPEASHTAVEVFAINTMAPFWLAAELARQSWMSNPEENLRHNRNIVNVASSAGLRVYPGLSEGVYSASKAALIQISSHLASEFSGLGVRVNSVAPETFPGAVAIDEVVDAITALDSGDQTGQTTTLLPAEPRRWRDVES